jgi:hypothetical protein
MHQLIENLYGSGKVDNDSKKDTLYLQTVLEKVPSKILNFEKEN